MSEIKYQVIVSDRASRMLIEQVAFMARVNASAANKVKQALLKALRSLETFPKRNPFFNEAYIPSNKYHKMYVEKYYLVLYQIIDTNVFVDYILDCRKEYDWLV
ncbi:MAG: type II toxin-antitoxin system RelE/ParE family toxin [Faecalibacterium sp.]